VCRSNMQGLGSAISGCRLWGCAHTLYTLHLTPPAPHTPHPTPSTLKEGRAPHFRGEFRRIPLDRGEFLDCREVRHIHTHSLYGFAKLTAFDGCFRGIDLDKILAAAVD